MLHLVDAIAELSIPLDSQNGGRECYAFSEREDRAFALTTQMAQALFDRHNIPREGYEIKTDAIGNLFVTLYGVDRTHIVMAGSHLDSVLQGGKFDGVAGVNSAFNFLEHLLQQITAQQTAPQKSYTMAVFRSEESSPKTGVTCIGSRIATGTITPDELEKISYTLDNGKKISFHEYFKVKYGPEEGELKWQAILSEIANPPITQNAIVAYEELHIEQSGVCEALDVDVGIVIDGIGGAIRQIVHLPLRSDLSKTLKIDSPDTHQRITFTFVGQEAHTGGTPPNRTDTVHDSSPWYRKDALIGASHFVKQLFERELGDQVQILNMSVPELTGFTTVPRLQTIELLVPNSASDKVEQFIHHMQEFLEHSLRIDMQWNSKPAVGTMRYLDRSAFLGVEIPLLVERLARETVNSQIEQAGSMGVGRVRGTTTDFRIQPGRYSETGEQTTAPSIDFNIDLRDVDPSAIAQMNATIRAEVARIAEELIHPACGTSPQEALKTVSAKPYTSVDPVAVEDKTRIAHDLGLNVVKMPSLPGHDAASLGQIGIPISMTFVRHDGLSHNSRETMSHESYAKAELLSHAFLEQRLMQQ
ncbi:MAG: hypothetical protein WC101_02405 [Candidatus Gracilibacteria bacterium]